MRNIMLRNVIEDDLPIFFKHQQNHEANHMAAFTSKDPSIGMASLHTGTNFLLIGKLLSRRLLSKRMWLGIFHVSSSSEN